MVHDINPAILGRQDEERHQSLAEIVEVVLVVDPAVAVGTQLQALGFVRDVLGVGAVAVKKYPFEKLFKAKERKDEKAYLDREIH